MLPYPQIDPVALAIGPLKIHWYGLMYLIGIGAAWLILSKRLHRFDPTWTKEKLSDLVFWVAMGVIVGGRLGYVLFYDLSAYIANPLLIFEVWKGGMAFPARCRLPAGRDRQRRGALHPTGPAV